MSILSRVKEFLKKLNTGRCVRWESQLKIKNIPLIAIAWGQDTNGSGNLAHAKGIIAIGQVASGVIAIGLISYGYISIGLVSFGLVSFSWLVGFGLISFSGLAFGIIAFGGAAIGVIAFGGMAIGYIAIGGFSVGIYSVGGFAIGQYIISEAGTDTAAVEFFSQYTPWLLKSFGINN